MILPTSINTNQLLYYADQHFETYSYLNGNQQQYPHNAFPELIAMGCKSILDIKHGESFSWQSLDEFVNKHQQEYIIGFLNYQLKNKIESFPQELRDTLDFSLVQLYVPQFIFIKKDSKWHPYNEDSAALLSSIKDTQTPSSPVNISISESQFSHDEYIDIVSRIKKELAQGNIYEINFCTNYTGQFSGIDYIKAYQLLNVISPMPFSALHKYQEQILISASPERFIKKEKNTLYSQPIKGTAARKENKEEDLIQIDVLEHSLKERTENIMIVDLVRNDLAKICKGGSVIVEELCKVYSFEKVHQLISTIRGELENPDTTFSNILKALFPMGSMTGAPKYKAMQLIDELEKEGRGLFSGTFGYISPNGDFDFNVIIRSILWNEKLGLYQYHAGSAITIASDAEQEYQECRLKTLPIRLLIEELGNSNQGSVIRDQ